MNLNRFKNINIYLFKCYFKHILPNIMEKKKNINNINNDNDNYNNLPFSAFSSCLIFSRSSSLLNSENKKQKYL